MKLDDNREYIVKFANEKKDSSIMGEWICGKLARKLDLPMVEFDAVQIDQAFINGTTELIARLIPSGNHFAAAYVNGSTNLSSEIARSITIDKIENAEKIPGMIAFDIFVCNVDRSPPNSLIAPVDEGRQRYNYFLIDHGLCFGGHAWNEASLNNLPMQPCGIPWNTSGISGPESFTPIIEQLKSLERKDFQDMVDSIPLDWNANTKDMTKLVDVLVNRSEDQILNVLEGIRRSDTSRFPDWR